MIMRLVVFLYVFASVISLNAGLIPLAIGNWKFGLNDSNGNLENIFYSGDLVLHVISRKLELEQKILLESFVLKNYSLNKNCLKLVLQSGNWRLEESLQFDAYGRSGLLERKASLLLVQGKTEGEAFGSYISELTAPPELDFYMPYSVAESPKHYQIIRKDADFYDLERPYWIRGNTSRYGESARLMTTHFGNDFMLLRKKNGTVLAVLADSRTEPVRPVLVTGRKKNLIETRVLCSGWAFPGKTQNDLGRIYLQVQPNASFDSVIDQTIPAWYALLGMHAPLDRPSWVKGGRILQFNPVSCDERDRFLRMEETLLPRAKALGYNILYAQPVISGPHQYLPVYFDRLAGELGSPDGYRSFIRSARSQGFRYWQDIVTHGSKARENAMRNMNLALLIFNRDGRFTNRYFGDYMNPEYRAYIARNAEFLMSLGPDGFRVDMPYGSAPNWRKKGFPGSNTPQKLSSLEKEWYSNWFFNHVMPDLPYERASLCLRSGRLINPMLRKIVRRHVPDGAILGELTDPIQGTWADTIYDLCWDYYGVYYSNNRSERFVSDIRRFFYEQKKFSPPGTLWTHEFQSHDTIDMYARLGTGVGNCAYALTVLSEGLSMTQVSADIGHGDFIARLNALFQKRPELVSGETDYLAVKCSSPEVWSVLRSLDGQCSFALINFSNKFLKTDVRIEPEKTGLPFRRVFSFVDLLDESMVLEGSVEKLSGFSVELPPFGVRVIASGLPRGKKASCSIKYNQEKEKGHSPVLNETAEGLMVGTKKYSLKIDKKSGQLEWLKDSAGKLLLNGSDLIFARAEESEASVRTEETKDGIRVSCCISNSKGKVDLEYFCKPEKLAISGNLFGAPGGEYVYWYLPGAHPNSSWKANTFDGVMADRIYGNIRPLSRYPHLGNNTNYRDDFYRVQWSSERNPLDPSNAVCGIYRPDGNGIMIRFPDGFTDVPPAMEFLSFGGTGNHPGYAVWLQSPSDLLSGKIANAFRMELVPAEATEFSENHAMTRSVVGGVLLQSESTGAVIANTHYEVHLRRLGGMVRLLRDQKTGAKLIDRMTLCSMQPRYSSDELVPHYDGFGGFLIRRINGKLYMRYSSHFRGSRRGGMLDQQLQGIYEYWFDDSPVFTAVYTLETPVPWNFPLALRSTVGNELPKMNESRVIFQNGNASVTVSGLNAASVRKDRVYFVASYFDDKQPFPKERRFRQELSFCLNNVVRETRSVASLCSEKYEKPCTDFSFEILGSAYSVRKKTLFPHALTMLWKNLGIRFHTGHVSGQTILIDPQDACDGTTSMVLKGYDGYLNPCFKLALNSGAVGSYRLTMAVKSYGNRSKPDVRLSVRGSHDDRFCEIPLPALDIPKDSDWHDVSVMMTLPKNLAVPWLQVVFQKAAGTVMFDHIRIERVK